MLVKPQVSLAFCDACNDVINGVKLILPVKPSDSEEFAMSGGGGGGGDWRPDPIKPKAKPKGDLGGGEPDPCAIFEVTT